MRWGRVGAALVVVAAAVYFAVPLLSMARFAFQLVPVAALTPGNLTERWTLAGLADAFTDPALRRALGSSGEIMVGTILLDLGLLVPTSIWAHLRTPRLRPLVEGMTLLPWVVPPIALVVGVAGTFRGWAPWFLSTHLSLIPFYVVLSLPFTYRALDAGLRAIDLRTLTEAARGLGAGWWATLAGVVLPNIRGALVGASFLTATVVLGEFTIASLLLETTFPTYLLDYQRSHPQGGMGLALLSMLATAVLLTALGGRRAEGARVV